MGWPVEKLQELYASLGPGVFKKSWLRFGMLRPKFAAKPLRRELAKHFGDVRLGDSEIQTGLTIVTKRLDTNSPWPLFNNPKGKYFDERPGSKSVPNKRYLIRDLIRASTAAPHYFKPERIRVSTDVDGTFVDGGVSPHNNPALQLFLLATLKGYQLSWKTGEDHLLIVSVGTGHWRAKLDADLLLTQTAASNAISSLLSMMDDSSALNELILQGISRSTTARKIDGEVGTLEGDILGGTPLLSYLRYDAELEVDWLNKYLPEEQFNEKRVEALQAMDEPDSIGMFRKIGQAAAETVRAEHFPDTFAV